MERQILKDKCADMLLENNAQVELNAHSIPQLYICATVCYCPSNAGSDDHPTRELKRLEAQESWVLMKGHRAAWFACIATSQMLNG
mmetsp:Transcript_18080/g.32138  ORF Transcript_18080/g.32138 Transcript_18080/m.32138 type:complete len:86 (-) Transcript_18080:34-291(-)